MSSPEEEEGENNLLNKLLNKLFIVKSFSVKRHDFNKLLNFQEKCRLEQMSFSEGVVKAINEYLQHHPLPNPQVTLERSFNLKMPMKPTGQCCVGDCRGKARFLLTLVNFEGKTETFQVCRNHKKWKHPEYRFLKSYRPLKK